MMDLKLYNDYEILYLIKEGNEVALSFIFKKYEPYIWKIASAYHRYNDKREDLVPEPSSPPSILPARLKLWQGLE